MCFNPQNQAQAGTQAIKDPCLSTSGCSHAPSTIRHLQSSLFLLQYTPKHLLARVLTHSPTYIFLYYFFLPHQPHLPQPSNSHFKRKAEKLLPKRQNKPPDHTKLLVHSWHVHTHTPSQRDAPQDWPASCCGCPDKA